MKNKVFRKVCVGLVASIIILALCVTVSAYGKDTDYRYEKYDYKGSYYEDYDYESYGYLGYYHDLLYSYVYEFLKYLYERFPALESIFGSFSN